MGVTHYVQAHQDRYLLAFFGASSDCTIFPAPDDTLAPGSWTMTVSSPPFIITHHLHGSLVNCRWGLQNFNTTADMLVVECFMVPDQTPTLPSIVPTVVGTNLPSPVSMNIPAALSVPVEQVVNTQDTSALRPAAARGEVPGLPQGRTMAEVQYLSQTLRPFPDPNKPITYLQAVSDEVIDAYRLKGVYVWYDTATGWYYREV